MAIPIVGKCFDTASAFLDYLDDVKFGAWRPRFVTVHHTGSPDCGFMIRKLRLVTSSDQLGQTRRSIRQIPNWPICGRSRRRNSRADVIFAAG